MKIEKANKIALYVLAGIIVVGFFVLMYILLFQNVPQNNKDMANIAVGALIGAFTSITGYFFGSSAGSAEKTQLLNKTTDETTPATPAV
jgi:uncharacterized BrkB/YihY/UPF0761 family membrane protein